MSNTYRSITKRSEGLFKDRGSKFIAYLLPCTSPYEFENELSRIKKLHPKSRHFCYAYRFLDSERMNDDGEPSGTAGKPIMGQIIKADLKNVAIIVVRYFGGILLGTGGLIQAYKTTAALAIEAATIVEMVIRTNIEIKFDYRHLSELMSSIKKHQFQIKSKNLGSEAQLILSVPRDQIQNIIDQIKSDVGHVYLSQINDKTQIPGLNFIIYS